MGNSLQIIWVSFASVSIRLILLIVKYYNWKIKKKGVIFIMFFFNKLSKWYERISLNLSKDKRELKSLEQPVR